MKILKVGSRKQRFQQRGECVKKIPGVSTDLQHNQFRSEYVRCSGRDFFIKMKLREHLKYLHPIKRFLTGKEFENNW